MLNSINISHIFVFDQQKALDFYVGKLGLEVSNDLDLGVMRWLTVRAPGAPSHDILLELPGPPSMDEKTAAQVRETISKGGSGFAAGFTSLGTFSRTFRDIVGLTPTDYRERTEIMIAPTCFTMAYTRPSSFGEAAHKNGQ